jgi:hypothetical protein
MYHFLRISSLREETDNVQFKISVYHGLGHIHVYYKCELTTPNFTTIHSGGSEMKFEGEKKT